MQPIYKIKFFHRFGGIFQQIDTINDWFKKDAELTIVKDNERISRYVTLTDGVRSAEVDFDNIYRYKELDIDGYIVFRTTKGTFFKCKLEDYVEGAELTSKPAKEEPKKLTEEEKQKATQEAKEEANFLGLPSLSGTQKQKDWALKIRSDKLKDLSTEDSKKLLSNKNTKKSKFWIDNRFIAAEKLIGKL